MEQSQQDQQFRDECVQRYVEEALNKIYRMYNDPHSRGFILHLVAAFIPINEWNKYLSTDKVCAITGMIGYNLDVFFEMTKKSIFLKAKMIIGDDNGEAEKEYQEMQDAVIKRFGLREGETLLDHQMYCSNSSDKCLSPFAIIALKHFVERQLLQNDETIVRIILGKAQAEARQLRQQRREEQERELRRIEEESASLRAPRDTNKLSDVFDFSQIQTIN